MKQARLRAGKMLIDRLIFGRIIGGQPGDGFCYYG